MKKKILVFVLALACTAGSFGTATALDHPVTVEAATKKTPTLSKVYNAVKKAYGKNYLPQERLDKEMIKDRYGIPSSWYKGVIAEVPMMSTQVDEFVIVKAKDAATKRKIKRKLNEYRNALKNDSFQYPQNQLKIQASRVYIKDNYVCFIMLGTLDNATSQQEESKVIAAYRAENAKAVKAIQKLYQ